MSVTVFSSVTLPKVYVVNLEAQIRNKMIVQYNFNGALTEFEPKPLLPGLCLPNINLHISN